MDATDAGDVQEQSLLSNTDQEPRKLPYIISGRSTFYNFYDQYWDGWYPEISAILTSAACLVAAAAILDYCNGKFVPHLSHGVTLNAIISILATTSKALLLFAVSNAIGQLKWVWLNSATLKPLSAIAVHDDASRGPLGAFKVLRAYSWKSLMTIGVLVTIFALAIDPFVQQVIVFTPELQYQNSSTALITQARFFDPLIYSKMRYKGKPHDFTGSLTASGLWGFGLELQPDCRSGNCIWEDYQTTAWCTNCGERQTLIMQGDCTIPATFGQLYRNSTPCTAHSVAQDLQINASLYHYGRIDQQGFSDMTVGYPISNLTVLPGPLPSIMTSAVNSTDPRFFLPNASTEAPVLIASLVEWKVQTDLSITATRQDCTLDICTAKGRLKMTNGQLNFDKISHVLTTKSIHWTDDGYDTPVLCFAPADKGTFHLAELQNLGTVGGRDYDIRIRIGHGRDLTFCMPGFNGEGLESAYLGLLGSRSAEAYMSVNRKEVSNISWPPNMFNTPLWNNTYYLDYNETDGQWNASTVDSNSTENQGQIFDKGFENVMRNLTAGMTRLMLNPSINENGTAVVVGMAGTLSSRVTVRWAWFALPACLWLIGFMFLLLTMHDTRRTKTPLWKSSTNALLYHGLDPKTCPDTQLSTISAMNRQGLRTLARLSAQSDIRRRLETIVIESHEKGQRHTT